MESCGTVGGADTCATRARCKRFLSQRQLFTLPTARLFIRRAGPPATAWPPQDAEEDAPAAAGTVVTCRDG